MSLVQHNNKYPRTRFNKLQIGAIFSLGVNGTPLVKVDNNSYGVLALATDSPVAAVPFHNGPIFYFAPAVTISSNGTEVFEPGPNPYILGNESLTPDPSVIEQDPPFFLGYYDQPFSPNYTRSLVLQQGATYTFSPGNAISLRRFEGFNPVENYTTDSTFVAGGTNYLLTGPAYSGPLPAPLVKITSLLTSDEGSSFLLSASYQQSSNELDLSWTFPNLLWVSPNPDQLDVKIVQVVLQRSTSTRKTPFGPVGDGPFNFNVNDVDYSTVPSDPAWETILNLTPDYIIPDADPDYPIQSEYTDTPPATELNHIFHYRLLTIVVVQDSDGNQFGLPKELDWNVITVVTPYAWNLPIDGSIPRNITWTVPSGPELSSLSRLFLNSFAATRSTTPLATTSSGFTMPPADNITQSSNVSVDTNSFITGDGGDYFNMAGAGVVRLVRGTLPNTIQVINSGMAGNTSAGDPVSGNKAITKVTELTWVFDLPTLPTNYTLERRASDSTTYSPIATLDSGFSQPFKDALPPNPELFYRLTANMPVSEGINEPYPLVYNIRSIS